MENNSAYVLLNSVLPHPMDQYVTILIYQSIILLFGVPGNCLILCVYWGKTPKTSTHVLIWSLALADLVICSFGCAEIMFIFTDVDQRLISVIVYLYGVAFNASMIMTAAIAFDRYDCVCRPQRRLFTSKRAVMSALMSLAFSIINNIPIVVMPSVAAPYLAGVAILAYSLHIVCFTVVVTIISVCYGKVYQTIKKHVRVGVPVTSTVRGGARVGVPVTSTVRGGDNLEHETRLPKGVVPCSPNADHSIEVSLITTISPPTISSFTPNTDVGAGTSHQFGTAGQSTTMGSRNGHSANQNICVKNDNKRNVFQQKTTLMLFATSVLFLVSYIPVFVSFILIIIELGVGGLISHQVVHLVTDVGLIVYINSAINPWVYGVANRRFRKDCARVLRKIKWKQ